MSVGSIKSYMWHSPHTAANLCFQKITVEEMFVLYPWGINDAKITIQKHLTEI